MRLWILQSRPHGSRRPTPVSADRSAAARRSDGEPGTWLQGHDRLRQARIVVGRVHTGEDYACSHRARIVRRERRGTRERAPLRIRASEGAGGPPMASRSSSTTTDVGTPTATWTRGRPRLASGRRRVRPWAATTTREGHSGTGTTRSASAACKLRPDSRQPMYRVTSAQNGTDPTPHPPPRVPVTTDMARTPVHTEHCRAAPRDRRWPMAAISWTEEDCARRTHVFRGRVHRINARVYVRRSRRSWGGGRRGRAPCWRD